MKNLKKISMYAVVLFTTALIISSCRKDDDGGGNGGNNQATEGTIAAKVNGTQVTSSAMSSSAMYASGMLTVQGTTADLKNLKLIIVGAAHKTTGTYDIGGTNSVMVNASYMEMTMSGSSTIWVAPYSGGAVVGSITITEWTDTKVVGTFKFDAALQSGSSHDTSNMKNVTEGSFNMKL